MELQALATAVQDHRSRDLVLRGMSTDEADAFEVYIGEFEACDREHKQDKAV